jgi:hypothetical protein
MTIPSPGPVPPIEFVELALRIADGVDRMNREIVALESPEQKARCASGTCDCAYHAYFAPTQVSVGVWP